MKNAMFLLLSICAAEQIKGKTNVNTETLMKYNLLMPGFCLFV